MNEVIRHLEEFEAEERSEATVISNERITPASSTEEVRELELEIDRPEFEFRLGQSIGVLAPGAREFGKEHHFRLYSVADLPERGPSGLPRIRICVRRCSYIDEYSGEEFDGIASNFLCDRRVGDTFEITGPFGVVFEIPEDHDANLILIGSGTGIAPFRAFVKSIYAEVPDFTGKLWLFYGARSGLELLYMNDERDDFAQYYDHETFEAFHALAARPGWSDQIDWHGAIDHRGKELWMMLAQPSTYVYVAGLEKSLARLDEVFTKLAGSEERWQRRKAELKAGGRWVELIY